MSALTRLRRAIPPATFALAAVATAIALTLSPLTGLGGAPVASAQLLEGPGYLIPHATRISMVGAFRAPDGSLAYCLEWGKESPTLASDPLHSSSLVTTYEDWGSAEVARVNWLISTHGQSANRDRAAAVAIAIWLRHPGSGEDLFHANNRFLIAAIPDDATRSRIVADAVSLSAQMDAYNFAAPMAAGELRVVPDADDALQGEIVLTGLPIGSVGVLRLSGAFIGAANDTEIRVAGDSRVTYRLAPSGSSIGSAEVQANADLTLPGGVPGPALRVWESAPALQDAGAAGPVQNDFSWTLGGTGEHSLVFSPTLTTQVPARVIAEGDSLSDTFRLSLADGAAPWRTFADGTLLPLTVVCRAYGPFEVPQAEAASVPVDAPLATEPVRLQVGGTADDPLLKNFEFAYALVPEGGGYYTSVCEIDAADQDDPRSVQGMPAGYRFSDSFGLVEETQFSPLGVRFETTLSDSQTHPGAEVVDVIVGEAWGGPWAEWAGEGIRVPLVGTVYRSDNRPSQSAVPPEGAESVATVRAELTEPGRRAEVLIQLPDRPGWYTVRWCTDPAAITAENGEPLVRLWCDDYGIPSETVHAVAPSAMTPKAEAESGTLRLATTGSPQGAVLAWIPWTAIAAGVGALIAATARVRGRRRGSPQSSSGAR